MWPWSKASSVTPVTSLPNPLYTSPSSSSSTSNVGARLLQEQYKQFLDDRRSPNPMALGLSPAVLTAMKNVKGANAIPRSKAGKWWGSTTRNNANVKKNMNANVQRFALLKDALSDPDNDSYDQEAADYFAQVARRARTTVEKDKNAARVEAERAAREHREAEEEAARAQAEAAALAEAEAAAEGLSRREREAAEAASKKAEKASANAEAVAKAAAKVAAKARYEALCAEDEAFCSLERVRNERTRRGIVGTGPVYMAGNTKNFTNSNISKIRAQLLKEYPRKGMNAKSYAIKLQDMLFMILSRGSWDALPNATLRSKLRTYKAGLTGPTNLTRRALVERVFRRGVDTGAAIDVANAAVPLLSGNATAAGEAAAAAVAAANEALQNRGSTNANGRSEEAEELNRAFVNATRGLTPRQLLNAAEAEERARRAGATSSATEVGRATARQLLNAELAKERARRAATGVGRAAARRGSDASMFGNQNPFEFQTPPGSVLGSSNGTSSRPSSASRSRSGSGSASALAAAIQAGQQRRRSIFGSSVSPSRRGSMSSRASRSSSTGSSKIRPAFGTAARVATIYNKSMGMGNAAERRREEAAAERALSQQSGLNTTLAGQLGLRPAKPGYSGSSMNPLFGRPPPMPPTNAQISDASRRKIAKAALSRGFALPPLQSRVGMNTAPRSLGKQPPSAIQKELTSQQNAFKKAQSILAAMAPSPTAEGEAEAAAELDNDEEEIFSSGVQLPASPTENSNAQPGAPVTAWQGGRKGSRRSKGKGKGKSKRRNRK